MCRGDVKPKEWIAEVKQADRYGQRVRVACWRGWGWRGGGGGAMANK